MQDISDASSPRNGDAMVWNRRVDGVRGRVAGCTKLPQRRLKHRIVEFDNRAEFDML